VGSVAEAVEAQIARIRTISEQSGAEVGIALDGDIQERFWEGVGECGPGGDDRVGVALKASVLIANVFDTIRRGEEIARSIGIEAAAISEAGSGVIRFHWSGGTAGPGVTDEALASAIDGFRRSILSRGGSLVVLAAPRAVKARVDVWGPVGSALGLMLELKRQFDPKGILNPGRFVGGI
jgi:glycolate oxidase FAD binding subunit